MMAMRSGRAGLRAAVDLAQVGPGPALKASAPAWSSAWWSSGPGRCLSTTGQTTGWFNSEKARTQSHSTLLSEKPELFEIVQESVMPKDWTDYLQYKGRLLQLCDESPDIKIEHFGSWHYVHGGQVFSAMHLFKYPEGWKDIDHNRQLLKVDVEYLREYNSGVHLIGQQSNEFLKTFTYWPVPDKRTGSNVYDVRTYHLKPGSMYDWGNYWAKGIKCRQKVRSDIPYAGLFSQLGKLHTIYHIWAYKDLQDRNTCRANTWNSDGWNEIVANTVPLINKMETRILEPLPFSPTK